ncbi:hypothetical protein N7532_010874 [Penicillium argentinense]|uniref:C2H2-type domain-containing protein n=1 Tax=Penicillium argentinense TaxID=1131581 RepID=A0A9W9EQF1_9EURO|nr:uncharacterized protein N7532_010874 [Penicillium argentinense]KAJ5086103.1 hypothetical protein N7532_010874 [Penicillium argentinense]
MKAHYSPSNALLDFDREVDPLSLFSEKSPFTNNTVYSVPGMSTKRTSDWESNPPGSSGSRSLDPSTLVGLTGIPVSSSTGHPHSTCVNPQAGYVPAHAHSVTFLAPESYLSDQRDSTNDPMDSLYNWSNSSNAEELKPSPSVDPTMCSASTSPFMPPYYSFGPPTPSMHSEIQASNGYTPQQINKWCMESDPAGSFYQPTTTYPAMSPLAFPPAEMSPNVYSGLNDSVSTSAEHWLSIPAQDASFLSPSATAISIDSSSAISTSPAPTLSDFEYKSSSPPFNPADLTRYGIPAGEGVWRCAHPGCTSQALFRRGCDLRKHFNRHRKHLFCRHEGCPQSRQGGFSSKKDRARHEAKHNPGIVCEWDGCGRVFSRVDNMKDHVRRIHRRGGSR